MLRCCCVKIPFSLKKHHLFQLFPLMVLMMYLSVPTVDRMAFASDKGKDTGNIQIKSDSLVAYNEASYAEFTGNVIAVQGTTQITSDKLKIYYSKESENKGSKGTGEESIKKVVASGKVVIRSENRTAYTSMAEYTPATKVVILSGPDSKVVSGNNFVSGDKITFYVNEDRVIVERGKEKQVEAVFYSGELENKP
jgi:lipopolysaccharide export system protein LptA